MCLNINEIFYSIQGEGINAGLPFIFIRLAGCSVQNACMNAGVKCDTYFESGKQMSRSDILTQIDNIAPQCKRILWTGGEPTDQLNSDITSYFKEKGFYQAIETSGIRIPPLCLDWITVSPKLAVHVIKKIWNETDIYEIDELRILFRFGLDPSEWLNIKARNYVLSPMLTGTQDDFDLINAAINQTKNSYKWRLSIQLQKFLNIR